MIDTHTHLYFPDFKEDINNIIEKSRMAGVTHFILPNVDRESLILVKDLHSNFPDITSMAIGLHPSDVKGDWISFVDEFEKELDKGNFRAIGEIGIDLYHDKTFLSEQKEAFERQLRLAEKYRLPAIIHSRDALEETLKVIEKVQPTVSLIFHSFTGNIDNVRRIREICDPYFGINGVVTFKNAPALREAIPEIGLERILLETDAPYLAPTPFRGQRNDSSLLIHIKDKIAEILSISPQKVDKETDFSATEIFNL